MNLASKLFFSHLTIVMLSVMLVAGLTATVAPVVFFTVTEYEIVSLGRSGVLQTGSVTTQSLDNGFREAINGGLLIAGVISTVAAAGAGWYMSRRIVRPIKEVVEASQEIASGRYDRRLAVTGNDELSDLSTSFNQMAESLADIENTRKQLLADVSHELKTPLASIKGYMEGLEDGVVPASSETFHLVYREADRLQRLVRDLEELSQAESTLPQLNLDQANIVQLVSDVVAQMQPQFDEKGVSIAVKAEAADALTLVDSDRIRQVLTNLVGNALQYTPCGGDVIVSVGQEHASLCVSVKDTGIGLAESDLGQIFQRFYRVDKSRSRSGGGSGIGLTDHS